SGALSLGGTASFRSESGEFRSSVLGASAPDARSTAQWLNVASIKSPAWGDLSLQGVAATSAFVQAAERGTTSGELAVLGVFDDGRSGAAVGFGGGSIWHGSDQIGSARALGSV